MMCLVGFNGYNVEFMENNYLISKVTFKVTQPWYEMVDSFN